MSNQEKSSKFKYLAWFSNILIWGLSLAPIGDRIPSPIKGSDLIYHGLAYCGLIFLFLKGYPRKISLILGLLFFQGVAIEIIQPYTGRFFEWWDMLANSLGLLLGWLIHYISIKPRSFKSTGPSK
jgi:VanZ family protein